jgi:hypothetical protein
MDCPKKIYGEKIIYAKTYFFVYYTIMWWDGKFLNKGF